MLKKHFFYVGMKVNFNFIFIVDLRFTFDFLTDSDSFFFDKFLFWHFFSNRSLNYTISYFVYNFCILFPYSQTDKHSRDILVPI